MMEWPVVAGVDGDNGNRDQGAEHGVSIDKIEKLFRGLVAIPLDEAHSWTETPFKAIVQTEEGRCGMTPSPAAACTLRR